MATEALAQLAMLFAPGYQVRAVENKQMMGAFKFSGNEPRTLYLSGQTRPAPGGEFVVQASLRSLTQPARAGLPAREQSHFQADVHLTPAEVVQPQVAFTRSDNDSLPLTADEIYDEFFHGPAYQAIGRIAIEEQKVTAIMAQERLYTLLETEDGGPTFDADVVDDEGKLYVRWRDYRTVSRPTGAGS